LSFPSFADNLTSLDNVSPGAVSSASSCGGFFDLFSLVSVALAAFVSVYSVDARLASRYPSHSPSSASMIAAICIFSAVSVEAWLA